MKKFFLTGDIDIKSGVDSILDSLSIPMRKYFQTKDYGEGLSEVCVVLMCQDSRLNLKRRVRYSRKNSVVYMDIMFNLHEMIMATPDERKRHIVQRMRDEIPEVLSRYKIPNFAREAFIADLHKWLAKISVP